MPVNDNILIIAHRGASGYEPENTLLSFRRAIELKADAIELDVHLCKTGELVVIHDEKINRTTDGKGKVADFSLEKLKQYDAGKGEKIPTLIEVLDLVNRMTEVHIELKGMGTAGPTANLIKEYLTKKKWQEGDFLVSSFEHEELSKFHRLLPKVRIGILFHKIKEDPIVTAQRMEAYSIHLSYAQLSEEMISKAHQAGLKVFTYTINKQKHMQKAIELGVDGVFSNYPDRLLSKSASKSL